MRRHKDILADYMEIHRPVIIELFCPIPDCRDVVYQGIEPDVGDVLRIERQFDSPGQAGFWSGNTKIVNGFLEEFQYLLLTERRNNEGIIL